MLDSLSPALAAGAILGFVACVPMGPVNVTVIDQSLRRGFRRGFWVGLGAICAETIYASLAMAGLSQIPGRPILSTLIQAAAVVVVVALGVRNLLFAPDEARSSARAEELEQRWHHPAAWLLGFLMTLVNLSLLLVWATLMTAIRAHHWVDAMRGSHIACLGGVFIGGLVWYTLLAGFVSHAHRRSPPQVLHTFVRFSGLAFLGLAVLLTCRILWPK